MLRHLKSILRTIGEAKCARLPDLQFPVQFMAPPVSKKAVQIVQILIPHLSQQSQMFIAEATVKHISQSSPLLKPLLELGFRLNNVLHLHETNLSLLKAYCEVFCISFKNRELIDMYKVQPSDSKVHRQVE